MEEANRDAREREQEYLDRVLEVVRGQLEQAARAAGDGRNDLFDTRREMWEDQSHLANFSGADDFGQLAEINQYLESITIRTRSQELSEKRVGGLKKMLDTPYFARVDFTEESGAQDGCEKIYIGRGDLMDEETYEIYVYDWRSPIASIFYRFERGPVEYEAPGGTVRGTVSLKRQYEIKKGRLRYFFDADVEIADRHLKEMLSQNASPKMKSIVETIQRDQDVIIRDSGHGLLMVQGAAGSGKTSVALHRVAWLMYRGLSSPTASSRILIISPNFLFGEYISQVLPDLGEENVETATFEAVCARVLEPDIKDIQPRIRYYERVMEMGEERTGGAARASAAFKSSETFMQMLSRLCGYYERRLARFEDIYYDGKIILDRRTLQSLLFRRDHCTVAVRLRQIESIVMDRVTEQRAQRLKKLEKFLMSSRDEHVFDAKERARLISIREISRLSARIHELTRIDYRALYGRLFCDRDLFYRMAARLELPDGIEEVRAHTADYILSGSVPYEDALGMTWLKTQMDGCALYRDQEQVVVDEAQDYDPIHFGILGALMRGASFTVLGDVNQTIAKCEDLSFYDRVRRTLHWKRSVQVTLEKSFRCTREITLCAMRMIGDVREHQIFGRSGPEPVLVRAEQSRLDNLLADAVAEGFQRGYGSIGILCRSERAARQLFQRLRGRAEVLLTDGTHTGDEAGKCRILPVYLSKGLEFDEVFVYDADDAHYHTREDRRLLYIAATRALHQLSFYCTGQKSRFIAL